MNARYTGRRGWLGLALAGALVMIGMGAASTLLAPSASHAQQPTIMSGTPGTAATPDCPPPPDPRVIAAALQRFERGYMVWFSDSDEIWVLYDPDGQGFSGTVERFRDIWEEGMPESDPKIVAPEGRFQPVRGFGEIWRKNQTVREKLSWGVEKQQGVTLLVETRGEKTWFNGRNFDVFIVNGDRWDRIDVFRK